MSVSGAKPGGSEKIWLLEDDPLVAKTVVRRLGASGYENTDAMFKASEIIEKFSEEEPCIAILDVCLGEEQVDGIDVCRWLRRNNYGGRVLVFTGDTRRETMLRAALAGADDYFIKGENLRVLCDQVERLLGKTPIGAGDPVWRDVFREGAFLASIGLSDWDLDLLVEICRDQPSLTELSRRLGRNRNQVLKHVSRIYKKLHLRHYAQLTFLLAILKLFAKRDVDGWEPRC